MVKADNTNYIQDLSVDDLINFALFARMHFEYNTEEEVVTMVLEGLLHRDASHDDYQRVELRNYIRNSNLKKMYIDGKFIGVISKLKKPVLKSVGYGDVPVSKYEFSYQFRSANIDGVGDYI